VKNFSNLMSAIEITNKTNAKIDALVHYFRTAPDKDKLWVIALFTGKRPPRPVKTARMKEWCLEITGLPEWIFVESYSTVGDLGETLALLLPDPKEHLDLTLNEWMLELSALKTKTDEEKKKFVLEAWQGLEQQERLIFNKLIGGSFRIGVSKKTLVNALSKYSGIDPNRLMHSIIGKWSIEELSFETLIKGKHINYDNSKLYPFCLAYALDKKPEALGKVGDWLVEQKWDGIRGQIVKRNGEIHIWSRGEELVTRQFPELVEVFSAFTDDFVLDGEILAMKDNNVLLFNDLQKRLNRKNVSKKLLLEIPIGFYAYDILELDGTDIREHPFSFRRSRLEELFDKFSLPESIRLSHLVPFKKWDDLSEIRSNSRQINSEGLMIKRKDSVYHSGRKKGDWWKWKVEPMTIDAVMIYAQKGSGRRSSKYTDYTFAVKKGQGLVTVAKAYSGLTDKEITEISQWVSQNAMERFGPVRTVRPELVFEIAFEGIALSNRHKSGVALRFPRISRWRRDKPVDEIDTIESVKQLITSP
jgi:DNA ligase-1